MEFINKNIAFIDVITQTNNISKFAEPLGFYVRDGIRDGINDLYMISVDKNKDINDYTEIQLAYDGLILEKNTNKVVCMSHRRIKDIPLADITQDDIIEVCDDGTIIRVYYYNGEIITATNRCINAKMSKWGSRTFHSLFTEVFLKYTGIDLNDAIDDIVLSKYIPEYKNNTYVFNLVHHENRIIIKYNNNILKMIGCYDNNSLESVDISESKLFCVNITLMPEEASDYITYETIRGILVRRGDKVFKVDSTYYTYLKDLRGNVPDVRFRVLELLEIPEKIEALKTEFPENSFEITMALHCVNNLIKEATTDYVESHIYKKRFIKPTHKYYTLLKRIHGCYGKSNPLLRINSDSDATILHRAIVYVVNTTRPRTLCQYFDWKTQF